MRAVTIDSAGTTLFTFTGRIRTITPIHEVHVGRCRDSFYCQKRIVKPQAVRWVGDNLWRRKDATDTVLLHLTRTDLGEEVRLRTTADAKSGVSMACLWIQAVAGGQKPCCNAYGGFRYEVGCSHLEVIAARWDLYFVKVDRSGNFFWKKII